MSSLVLLLCWWQRTTAADARSWNEERPRCIFNWGRLEWSGCWCGSNRKPRPDVTMATLFVVDVDTAQTVTFTVAHHSFSCAAWGKVKKEKESVCMKTVLNWRVTRKVKVCAFMFFLGGCWLVRKQLFFFLRYLLLCRNFFVCYLHSTIFFIFLICCQSDIFYRNVKKFYMILHAFMMFDPTVLLSIYEDMI